MNREDLSTVALISESDELKAMKKRIEAMQNIDTQTQGYTIVKRNGMLVPFRRERILHALEAAFRDTKNLHRSDSLPEEVREIVKMITDLVVEEALKRASLGTLLTVEGIQDIVEVKLMETGHHDVARDYIIYRDEHKKLRKDSPRAIKVLRRDETSFVRFNPMKIASAVERAFRDTLKIIGPTPPDVIEAVNLITNQVVELSVEKSKTGVLSIEMIQDMIEQQLMHENFFQVAKDFIIFRAERARKREKEGEEEAPFIEEEEAAVEEELEFTVIRKDGSNYKLGKSHLRKKIAFACQGYENLVSIDNLVEQSISNFYDGIKDHEVDLANIMAARAKIEMEPAHTYVAAHLLLDVLYREALETEAAHPQLERLHRAYFKEYFRLAVSLEHLDPLMLSFDLDKLAKAIDLKRDRLFTYIGLQTLYDRYFIHHEGRRLETPQIFWMRVAMGLAINEGKIKKKERPNFIIPFLDSYTSRAPPLYLIQERVIHNLAPVIFPQ